MIKIDNQPIAKTQMFKIKDNNEELLKKIFNSNLCYVYIDSITVNFKDENKEDFYKELHLKIKKTISYKCEGEKNINYIKFFNKKDSKCFFIYITNVKFENPANFDSIKKINNDIMISYLFKLLIKNRIINGLSEDYEIPKSFFYDDFYIGSKIQNENGNSKGQYYIDTFEPKILFNKDLISFKLIKKTFLTKLENEVIFHGQDYDNVLFLNNSSKKFIEKKEIDARKYNKSKFMEYKSYYPASENYSLNFLHKQFIEVFMALNISYEEVYFQSNYIVDNFITTEIDIKRDVIILNNYKPDEIEINHDFEIKLINQIIKSIKINKTIKINEDNIFDLDYSKNYLCINKLDENSKTTIKSYNKINNEIKELNAFSNAYDLIGNKNVEFDFYTNLKLKNFKETDKYITQGLNVSELYKKDGEKYVYKELNENKIKRVKKEIWLKEKIFFDKMIKNLNLEDGNFTIFFNKNYTNRKTIISLNIKIDNKTLHILDNMMFENELLFNSCYEDHIITKFDMSKYDETLYIYDNDNKTLLFNYCSDFIPKIIGNSKFNNIDFFKEHDDIKKTNKIEETPLPYYLTPKKNKQSHYIFLESNNESLYYFVSQKQNPQINFENQRLIYSIIVKNCNGENINPLNEKVTKLFLNSFTDDILLNNEVSKTCLFEKIAKEFIFI